MLGRHARTYRHLDRLQFAKIETGGNSADLSAEEVAQARLRMREMGINVDAMPDEAVRKIAADRARRFLDEAPMTAAQAATVILNGVKEERWRILVGEDAHVLDKMVRANPEAAYTKEFHEQFVAAARWRLGDTFNKSK